MHTRTYGGCRVKIIRMTKNGTERDRKRVKGSERE